MFKFVFVLLLLTPEIAFAQPQWKTVVSGFEATPCIEINPRSNGQIIYSAAGADTTNFLYFLRSDNSGTTWKVHNIVKKFHYTIHQIVCDPSDTSIIFALADSLFRSTDGGATWHTALPLSTNDGEELTYQASTNTFFFTPTDSLDIWKSDDNGSTWSRAMASAREADICALAVSPSGTILCGEARGIIERSEDGMLTWDTLTTEDKDTSETAMLHYVPGLPHTALATIWNSRTRSIFATTDDGSTWTQIASDSSWAWAIEIDPDPATFLNNMPQHFWVGLLWFGAHNYDVGETTNGGKTWQYSNLPVSSGGVWMLKYVPESKTIFAATNGGIYAEQIESEVSSGDVQAPDDLLIASGPGPHSFEIRCTRIPREVRICDALGRSVFLKSECISNQVTINALPAGCYLVRVTNADGQIEIRKVMVS